MAVLIVINDETGSLTAQRDGFLPFTGRWGISVSDYLRGSRTGIVHGRLLEAYARLMDEFDGPLRIKAGYIAGSPTAHGDGRALDIGAELLPAERESLRKMAIKLGFFRYVEPPHRAPLWVHVEV